jgi:hypothetical protein
LGVLVRAGNFDAQTTEASNYIAMRAMTSSDALWRTARRTRSQPDPKKKLRHPMRLFFS